MICLSKLRSSSTAAHSAIKFSQYWDVLEDVASHGLKPEVQIWIQELELPSQNSLAQTGYFERVEAVGRIINLVVHPERNTYYQEVLLPLRSPWGSSRGDWQAYIRNAPPSVLRYHSSHIAHPSIFCSYPTCLDT
ncbi:hypothetical protein QCA50_003674 [Cerrena zonata]|uniref:Uncharacterized protein n=1 Tax=Cerrena zonata TaxID=2478898 RepID=A0AAW0GUH5_9APHY